MPSEDDSAISNGKDDKKNDQCTKMERTSSWTNNSGYWKSGIICYAPKFTDANVTTNVFEISNSRSRIIDVDDSVCIGPGKLLVTDISEKGDTADGIDNRVETEVTVTRSGDTDNAASNVVTGIPVIRRPSVIKKIGVNNDIKEINLDEVGRLVVNEPNENDNSNTDAIDVETDDSNVGVICAATVNKKSRKRPFREDTDKSKKKKTIEDSSMADCAKVKKYVNDTATCTLVETEQSGSVAIDCIKKLVSNNTTEMFHFKRPKDVSVPKMLKLHAMYQFKRPYDKTSTETSGHIIPIDSKILDSDVAEAVNSTKPACENKPDDQTIDCDVDRLTVDVCCLKNLRSDAPEFRKVENKPISVVKQSQTGNEVVFNERCKTDDAIECNKGSIKKFEDTEIRANDNDDSVVIKISTPLESKQSMVKSAIVIRTAKNGALECKPDKNEVANEEKINRLERKRKILEMWEYEKSVEMKLENSSVSGIAEAKKLTEPTEIGKLTEKYKITKPKVVSVEVDRAAYKSKRISKICKLSKTIGKMRKPSSAFEAFKKSARSKKLKKLSWNKETEALLKIDKRVGRKLAKVRKPSEGVKILSRLRKIKASTTGIEKLNKSDETKTSSKMERMKKVVKDSNDPPKESTKVENSKELVETEMKNETNELARNVKNVVENTEMETPVEKNARKKQMAEVNNKPALKNTKEARLAEIRNPLINDTNRSGEEDIAEIETLVEKNMMKTEINEIKKNPTAKTKTKRIEEVAEINTSIANNTTDEKVKEVVGIIERLGKSIDVLETGEIRDLSKDPSKFKEENDEAMEVGCSSSMWTLKTTNSDKSSTKLADRAEIEEHSSSSVAIEIEKQNELSSIANEEIMVVKKIVKSKMPGLVSIKDICKNVDGDNCVKLKTISFR